MTRPTASRGYTLIEVLAAIAILVIVLPVLMKAYMMVGDVAAISRQRAEATAIAQSVLEEQISTLAWESGAASGDEQPGPTRFHWETSLTDWEEANTSQLTVRVTWTRGQQEYAVTIDTLVNTNTTITTTTGTTTAGGLP